MIWSRCTCPTCGTKLWSVLETRAVAHVPGLTRRRFLCFNGHRFTLYADFMDKVTTRPKHPGKPPPVAGRARDNTGRYLKGHPK